MTANTLHQGENNQDEKPRYELPVVKRSPEIYRPLPWGRDWPVGHDDDHGPGLNPPVGPPEQPRTPTRSRWSPLRRTLMVALITAFLGLESQLFWAGVTAPETASNPVEIVAPAVAAAVDPVPQMVTGSTLATASTTIELIYDASGSMLAPIEGTGTHRWDVAKSGMQTWLNSGAISLETSFGMHSLGLQRDSACGLGTSIALAPYSFEQAYNGIADTYPRAGGSAAIAASLRSVVSDLQGVQGPATIVVVASGAEGCGGDPAAEAATFASGQTNRHVHVVGVAIEDPMVIAQLRSIAEQGNGQYVAVSTNDELATALQQVVGVK